MCDGLGQHAAGGVVGIGGGGLLGSAERVDVRDDASEAVEHVARGDASGVDQIGGMAVRVEELVGDLVGNARQRGRDGRGRGRGAQGGRDGVADRLGVVGEVARLGDVAARVDFVDLAAVGVVEVACGAVARVVDGCVHERGQGGVRAGVGRRVEDLLHGAADLPLADARAGDQRGEAVLLDDSAQRASNDHVVILDRVVRGRVAVHVQV